MPVLWVQNSNVTQKSTQILNSKEDTDPYMGMVHPTAWTIGSGEPWSHTTFLDEVVLHAGPALDQCERCDGPGPRLKGGP